MKYREFKLAKWNRSDLKAYLFIQSTMISCKTSLSWTFGSIGTEWQLSALLSLYHAGLNSTCSDMNHGPEWLQYKLQVMKHSKIPLGTKNSEDHLARSLLPGSGWNLTQMSSSANCLARSLISASGWIVPQRSNSEDRLERSLLPVSGWTFAQMSGTEGRLEKSLLPASGWTFAQKSSFEGRLARSLLPGSGWNAQMSSSQGRLVRFPVSASSWNRAQMLCSEDRLERSLLAVSGWTFPQTSRSTAVGGNCSFRTKRSVTALKSYTSFRVIVSSKLTFRMSAMDESPSRKFLHANRILGRICTWYLRHLLVQAPHPRPGFLEHSTIQHTSRFHQLEQKCNWLLRPCRQCRALAMFVGAVLVNSCNAASSFSLSLREVDPEQPCAIPDPEQNHQGKRCILHHLGTQREDQSGRSHKLVPRHY